MSLQIKNNHLLLRLVSWGTVLEYYDIAIYSLLVKYLGANFYPGENGLFFAFLVFILGQCVRCLGGVILALLGDRYGKEKIFSYSILAMALATLTMGTIPSTKSWGILATILFSLGRLVQSIAFGTEFPGALTVLSVHSEKQKLGRSVGKMMAMSSLGMAVGISLISLETHLLNEAQMLSWGFRIPFLIGGGLSLICGYLRKYLIVDRTKFSVKNQFCWQDLLTSKKYIKISLCLLFINLFPATISILKNVFVVYLNQYYHWPFSQILLMIALGYLFAFGLKMLGGYLADFYNKINIVRTISCLGTLGIILVFASLRYRGGLIFFIIYTNCVTSLATASYMQFFATVYPYQVLYTWTSLIHNIASITASITPLVMNISFSRFNTPLLLLAFLVILGTLMCISSFIYPKVYAKLAVSSERN